MWLFFFCHRELSRDKTSSLHVFCTPRQWQGERSRRGCWWGPALVSLYKWRALTATAELLPALAHNERGHTQQWQHCLGCLTAPAGSTPNPREKGQEQFLVNLEHFKRQMFESVLVFYYSDRKKNPIQHFLKCLFKHRNFLYIICAHGHLSFHWIPPVSLQHLSSQELLHMGKISLRWLFPGWTDPALSSCP